jgi:hypothetical protein
MLPSSRTRFLGVVIAALFMTGLVIRPDLASATQISATATTFSGASLAVTVTIDDASNPGNLVITLVVEEGGKTGDLRGFYANVTDELLLPGLSVSGPEVTSSIFDANNVIRLSRGNDLIAAGTPCLCDFGVEFGSEGIESGDDFQKVTFVLSHISKDLDLSLFEEQTFGIRATSVGPPKGPREASSKLKGQFPVVPEPSTAILMLLGLTGLSAAGTRRA